MVSILMSFKRNYRYTVSYKLNCDRQFKPFENGKKRTPIHMFLRFQLTLFPFHKASTLMSLTCIPLTDITFLYITFETQGAMKINLFRIRSKKKTSRALCLDLCGILLENLMISLCSRSDLPPVVQHHAKTQFFDELSNKRILRIQYHQDIELRECNKNTQFVNLQSNAK